MKTLALVTAAVALAAGVLLGGRLLGPGAGAPSEAAPAVLATGTLLPERRALAPFVLTDTEGAPFTEASLRGRWTLLGFGFANCPDVCPMLLGTFRDVHRRLAERGLADEVRFVFVSVDPERDDLPSLKSFVSYFDPSFLGATGPHPELQRLTSQLGVMYQRSGEGDSALGYLVDHSATLLLIDPKGRRAAVFSAPHEPEGLAGDLTALLGAR